MLKEDNNALEEVVVVGYGTQKKATLTGFYRTGERQDVGKPCGDQCRSGLAGTNTGSGGDAFVRPSGNEDLKFQIRGATSVNGGEPLVIIDGVPALNGYSFQNMNSDVLKTQCPERRCRLYLWCESRQWCNPGYHQKR